MSRALLASDSSWYRSSVVEPTSAWSLPAPSLPSRNRPAISCSASRISSFRCLTSLSSSVRNSASSAAVHGSSPGFTLKVSAVCAADFAGAVAGVLFSFVFMATLFVGAFLAGVSAAVPGAAAPAFLATGFFATGFFATGFFATGFFAAVVPAGVVFAGALRAGVFAGSLAALFLAADLRWGADFLGAVAMSATPCLRRRLERTGRKTVGHVLTTSQSDAQTVDIR